MLDSDRPSRRLRRKERKRLALSRLPMARRRAYRAAIDVLAQGMDLWKMADNKTRLALMLLGPLNLVLLVLLSNSEIYVAIPVRERLAILAGVLVYAACAMTTFALAIGTLRPEQEEPPIGAHAATDPEGPLGIRHYDDVMRWDLPSYQRAWQLVTRGQLLSEVVEQAHIVAEANRRKFRALYYIFRGLQGMTALAVLLVGATAAILLLEGESEEIRLKHGVKLKLPVLRHDAEAGAGGTGATGPGRDWTRFPPVVDRTTDEEVVGLGDVHGAYDRLVPLLRTGGLVRDDPRAPGGLAWAGGRRTLVEVGDLIDKGPKSLEVLDLMMRLQAQARAAGGEVIVTLGNHEAEFLAHPGKKKAIELEKELDERKIDPLEVAEGRDDYGRFMRNLPLAARVNGWFFAHAGSTSHMSLDTLAQKFRAVVDGGKWKNPFLIGDDSVLEARKWWKGDEDDQDLAALPARHIVFGHDPGAFRDKGTIQQKFEGKLFLIDVGMTPAFDYSKGALLFIDRKGGLEVATSVDASGARHEVWRGPAAPSPAASR